MTCCSTLNNVPIRVFLRPSPIIMFSTSTTNDYPFNSYDVTITFRSIEDMPKINTNLYSNVYFTAKIDDRISMTSTHQPLTSIVRWDNEEWSVLKVPSNAKLIVNVSCTDEDSIVNEQLGNFEIHNFVNYNAPSDGHVVAGTFGQYNGRFHLTVRSTKSSNETLQLPCCIFDGPCRYSRHESLTVDRFTKRPTNGVSSTWKVQLRRIPYFFPPNQHPPLKPQSRPMYESYTTKMVQQQVPQGQLTSADDLWKSIFFDKSIQNIKPRIFTYIIDDHVWQFSETGYRFFTTVATKHTVLADHSDCIRYAGEFHIRPKFGWSRVNDDWEIVFDNASGTFSPNSDLLVNLKDLMLFNFPGLNIVTYDYKNPLLRDSIEQLEMNIRRFDRKKTTTNDRFNFSFT
ncbi:unnamed protein product [Adineta ricciae]|uniref:C2 domain-containing protein n=1 Tax=Adineta ricciae TaxID=249248 RepID=A0A815CJA4_ADIRI|nr:unnamed protein product [Adineta ricciae]